MNDNTPARTRIDGGDWSLSDEREFVENTLCQRFNFLLVVYSLVFAAAFSSGSQANLRIILTSGAVVCFMTLFPLARAQHKLDWILDEIMSRSPDHPITVVDRGARDSAARIPLLFRWFASKSRRRWIGYWIPGLCTFLTCCAAAAAWANVIRCGDMN